MPIITRAKLRGTKQESAVQWSELPEFSEGLVCLTGDEDGSLRQALYVDDHARASATLRRLQKAFGSKGVYVEIQRHLHRHEDRIVNSLAHLAQSISSRSSRPMECFMPSRRGGICSMCSRVRETTRISMPLASC
jgi:DNA polymerase III alpha subunit